jgi:CheY-like chemotaxis protein
MKPFRSPYILVVEDEPEVAAAIASALAPLEEHFVVEVANSAEDAAAVVAEAKAAGRRPGLVLCDHVLPGKQGVDFLIELQADPSTSAARKVLLTGQAGLQSTIQAVNNARLDHYIAKPWSDSELVDVSRRLLTDHVIATEENLLPFMNALDAGRIAEAIRRGNQGE